MTAVFVHGNPETAAVWGPLLAQLGRDDAVCLSPPGFGAPLPAGFGATVTEYRDWLVGEVEALGEPVHLVGHDWGGAHVVNLATARPDLLLSWTTDIIGVFDPDYVWHPLAQIWQRPGEGEQLVERMISGPLEPRVDRLVERGITRPVAEQLAAGQDADMGRAILALYRSAARPALAVLGRDLPAAAARPGLCLLATDDDMVGTAEQRRRSAARAGARTEVLEGLGHWWMVQDPARGAQVLSAFWADVEAGQVDH
ncbi:alpha/beta fold hydrolase [Pseudonocardia humida]|uniref:Alpha/beta hydrolase n=1 Tax=Pseudonocardia humida TaxID=2800819 RepID=A0ABT1ADD1_9PSEU|nr:alpha/beta hydrolase [Pseudonocardia humida]MCO1660764.1 alpha/beta hydrolase [Pseudonocardia humida]